MQRFPLLLKIPNEHPHVRSVQFFQLQYFSKFQRGYSFTELLVTMLLVSVGFLGVLAAQSQSLKGTLATSHQASAIQLLNDISQRILANKDASLAGHYSYSGGSEGVALGRCSDNTMNCDAEAIAHEDLLEWAFRLHQQLPGGDGLVEIAEANTLQITVFWQGSDNSGAESSDASRCESGRMGALRCITQSVSL